MRGGGGGGVVEVCRAHLASRLALVRAHAEPVARAVEALLVDKRRLAEVLVPREVVDLLLTRVHLEAVVRVRVRVRVRAKG